MEQSFEQGTLPISHRQRVFSLGIDRIQNSRDLACFPVVMSLGERRDRQCTRRRHDNPQPPAVEKDPGAYFTPRGMPS